MAAKAKNSATSLRARSSWQSATARIACRRGRLSSSDRSGCTAAATLLIPWRASSGWARRLPP